MKKFKERIGRDDSDIKEKRTKYSKTFKEDKKTYTTYVSNSEVHYFSPEGYGTHPEKDEWRDVDTNLSITQSLNPDKYNNHYLVSTNQITYGFRNDNKIEKFMGIREKYNDNIQIEVTPIYIRYDDNEYNLIDKEFTDINVNGNSINHCIDDKVSIKTTLVYNKVTNAYVIDDLFSDFEIGLDIEFNGCKILNEYYISNNTKVFIPDCHGMYSFRPTSSIFNKIYNIKHPYMWTTVRDKHYGIYGTLTHKDGKYTYTKKPTQDGIDWLYISKNPIFIDLSVNVSGNTDVAGSVNTKNNANWDVAHDAISADGIDVDGVSYIGIAKNKDDTYDIHRGFVSFSSSKLPSNAIVSAAEFKYSCTSILQNTPYINIRGSSWDPPLALGDYSGNFHMTGDGQQDSCDNVSVGLNTITLNASGVTYINDYFSQGYLRYCIRDNTYDVSDTDPVDQGNWVFYFGLDDWMYPPYLSVTYTLPAGVTYTSFKTPQYSGSAHHVALGWTWASANLNYSSGMCSFTGDGTSWKWYVISSSSTHFYPSGDATNWVWQSGNSGL